jgi:hypothetical protein
MKEITEAINAHGHKTVRASDDDLHRAARKAIHEGNDLVFGLLPATLSRIIKHGVWKTRGRRFKDFGEYALDQSQDGLGINSNQMLWLLRCAMDIHGEHIKEWAEVLVRVEEMVKVTATEEGRPIRQLSRAGLEELAKGVHNVMHDEAKITYLPSRSGGGTGSDSAILSLRKNHPETFSRVLAGEMSARQGMLEVRKKDGERVNHDKRPLRVRSDFLLLSQEEKAEFIQWLRDEGHL